MVDKLDSDRRSKLMGRIKGKDTSPEMIVRKVAHANGYRYRLHAKRLPGTPDLVFPSRRKIIFVHGCFWHQHLGCRKATIPQTRTEFWTEKLGRNVERDEDVLEKLTEAGWYVLTVWECELKDREALAERIIQFLDNSSEKVFAS